MAFDPALYNLISFTGLGTAFNPQKPWLLAIQDPNGDVINSITAENLAILLNGNIQLPDGVLNGLDVTINNASIPKTVSVSDGQWRINNGTYTINAPLVANINAPSVSDRIDAILADDTGSVYYQPNYNGVAIDGTIVVTTFTVLADGSDINPSPVIPAQYAVMNADNTGQFIVTSQGDFQPEIIKALSNINNAAKVTIKNASGGDYATAGVEVENDLGRKVQLLIAGSGSSHFGLLPDRAYILTNGATLDILAPTLLHNGVPIGVGGSLTTIPILSGDLVSIGDGFYSTPIPTLTDDQSIIAMLKIYPDQTDLATYYFKVPEIDGSDLINIEWDGVSDIKILLKIG